jgi:hypothetical protein
MDERDVAWFVRACSCGWRGAPCRTDAEIAAEPDDCPECGSELGVAIYKGSWRAFTRGRIRALRDRRAAS